MLRFDIRLNKKERAAEQKKARYLALKLYAIAKKGYHCSICKNYYNTRSMSFHHNENLKESTISKLIHHLRDRKLTKAGMKELDDELNKSILVCENCHQKIHEFESYSSDTYNNALHYLDNISDKVLGKDFVFDKNKFKLMYKEDEETGSDFVKKKLEVKKNNKKPKVK